MEAHEIPARREPLVRRAEELHRAGNPTRQDVHVPERVIFLAENRPTTGINLTRPMNIFVLDLNPLKAAQYHNDRHCVKMILETTQLLSTALPYLEKGRVGPYKTTHLNHPCSVWARACKGNYHWLWRLGIALCKEYSHRYGKVHLCSAHLENLKLSKPVSRKMTPFAQTMPERYESSNAVRAYRAYYRGEKRHIAKWTKRETPSWWR